MLTNITLNEKKVLGLGIAFLVVICFTLFNALTAWWHDFSLIYKKNDNNAFILPVTNDTTNIITAIPDEHLFGQSFTQTGDVPISSLALQVTGIVKVNDDDHREVSKAYISMGGNRSKIYQAGDTLENNIKIYGITQNSVILENKGQLEKLPLPREPLQFKPRLKEE